VYSNERTEQEEELKDETLSQIANEPAVVGLGDDNDEKKRRWTHCVAFLRNNPRLLLQMIPNPDDDEEELSKAITVGRPRPAKKPLRSSRPLRPSNMRPQQIMSQ